MLFFASSQCAGRFGFTGCESGVKCGFAPVPLSTRLSRRGTLGFARAVTSLATRVLFATLLAVVRCTTACSPAILPGRASLSTHGTIHGVVLCMLVNVSLPSFPP